MVILLGGTSCVGKTLMSQNLLEKYKIPYFSIDNLKMGLYRSDSNCGFTPTDSNEVISERLWPILREMIKTIIENNQSIIIEGCYLSPKLLEDFEAKYSSKIVPLFLVFSKKYIEENFESKIIKHRSVIEMRNYPEERPVTQFIEEHNKIRKRCIECGAKYFEIEKDYEEEIKRAYDYIEYEIERRKLY